MQGTGPPDGGGDLFTTFRAENLGHSVAAWQVEHPETRGSLECPEAAAENLMMRED